MSQLQNATIGINLSTANALRHIASDLQKNEEKVREALKRLQNIYAEEHAFLGIYEKKIRRLMLELAEKEKHMESVSAGIRMNSLRWANEIEQIVLEHTSPAGTMLPVPAEPEGINIDQLMNSVAINNGRKPITPKTKGEEIPLDCSGHSECFKWIPDPNETFLYKQNEYT